MSICCCQSIAKIKPVSQSVEKLIVAGFASGAYQAIIETLPKTRQYIQSLSTVGGALEIDMALPVPEFWNSEFTYRVTFIQDNDYSNVKTFTMDGTTYDCLQFTVVKSFNVDDTCREFADQTAELCNS